MDRGVRDRPKLLGELVIGIFAICEHACAFSGNSLRQENAGEIMVAVAVFSDSA